VALPAFTCANNPVGRGIVWAASVVLANLATRRLAARRAALALAALLSGLLLAPALSLYTYSYAVGVATGVAALLLACFHRHGLTALLTAAIVAVALPTALLAVQQLAWLPATAGGAMLVALLPLAAGVVGRRRPAAAERGDRLRPAFVLRLEDEQRVRYEMDLLARMQLGLLPEAPPHLPGWEIAARSLLANEAGGDLYDFVATPDDRLWIAAGDVSGHGYSCAIAQAMTKAGLASLIEPGRSPSAVLQRLDRVLRSGGAARTFTSLALLRLDPRTGEGVLANAGHPYPMLLAGAAVRELDLAALPLGQGPPREYAERPVALAPGDVLVFCSDGLFEGADEQDRAYGTERAAAVLGRQTGRSAEQVIDALLADWRQHLGGRALEDDTTLVVVRRLPAD
jgi:sigma-B regulation protein RsbU (phosphoserine phosphatase)